MSKPITPDEVDKAKATQIPEFVFEAVNELIVRHGDSNGATNILQKDIVNLILVKAPPLITKDDIYSKGWLNFEGAYEEAGWDVEYDKPGYNETYDASFSFTRRLKKVLI